MHTHIEFMNDWFREVWTEEKTEAISERFAGGGKAKGLGNRPVVGPKEFEQFQVALLKLITEVYIKIDDYICDGSKCSFVCTLTAKCRATAKPISITGSCFLEIEDGKIQYCENHFEFLDLYAQLGLIPEDTFAKALSGQKAI
ncbi:MAG: ester cyclase [Luteolibacter sp.]